MFFGGWLYPDALSTFAAADATLDEVEADWAEEGAHAAQVAKIPTKKKLKAFRTGITCLRFTRRNTLGG
jgi:hypothetical protein